MRPAQDLFSLYSCMEFKGWIYLKEAIIIGLTIPVKDNFSKEESFCHICKEHSVMFFTLPKNLFYLLAFGNVPDNYNYFHKTVFVFEERSRHFPRKNRAIFPFVIDFTFKPAFSVSLFKGRFEPWIRLIHYSISSSPDYLFLGHSECLTGGFIGCMDSPVW